jgi:hypothetical protein
MTNAARIRPALHGVRWLLRSVAASLSLSLTLAAGPAQASCTPIHQVTNHTTWSYANCSVADLDQLRSPSSQGFGGLPNNGAYYCVPTSAMDWMVWLSKWGYIPTIPNSPLPIPANKDWTDPSNFNQMSRYLHLMGSFMNTGATTGTDGDGLVQGIDDWLLFNAIKGHVTPIPGVVKVFQQVTHYDPDPNAMGLAAASGSLVMVSIGFYDSSGNRHGGHDVVLRSDGNVGNAGDFEVTVMDPNDPKVEDHVQSPYTPEPWHIFPIGPAPPEEISGWAIDSSQAETQYGSGAHFDGYSAIEPEIVFTADAPKLIADWPFQFVESRNHPRLARQFKLPGTRPILDFAVAPEGSEEPYVQAGSNAIWRVDALDGTTSRFADGPRGAAHLAFGGPTQTLFAAGTSQLVALDRSGRQITSAKLAHPLDGLAFDDHAGRLVAISAAQRRISFYSTDLRNLGSIRVPAALLAGRGAVSLAVSRTGAILVHRDGRPAIGVIRTAGKRSFRTERLAGVANPRGLAVDDRNHLFFDVRGHLVELLANGRRAKGSVFDGMPAASIVHVARNYSNAPANVTFQ